MINRFGSFNIRKLNKKEVRKTVLKETQKIGTIKNPEPCTPLNIKSDQEIT